MSNQRWSDSPWRLAILGVALTFFGFSIGYLATSGDRGPSRPGANSVDAGFLQDMGLHHDQGIKMAFILLDKPITTVQPTLRTIAYEIARDQQFEAGMMLQQLDIWGYADPPDTGMVMGWMNESVPEDRMPGLATQTNLQQLRDSNGSDGGVLFARLMIAHHQGGIHMADYAEKHAKTAAVRALAKRTIASQSSEIIELGKVAGLR